MMPTAFQRRDPETGAFREEQFLSVKEVAEMFHVSPSYVRSQLKRQRWQAFEFAHVFWFAPEHIDAIYEAQEIGAPIELADPPRIGLLLDPDEQESVR